MSSSKNVKWTVIGCVVLVCAVLVAVGPVLVTKYMRAKWERSDSYKIAPLLMKISGQVVDESVFKIYKVYDANYKKLV